MLRTYPQALSLTVAGLACSLLLPGSTGARALFNSKAIDQRRFVVLAQPVGTSDWKLLVLEQIKQRPRCWTPREDGLVSPTLNKFNFSGICSRYLDSNGYSVRTGGRDLSSRFRLRLMQSGSTLHLHAMDAVQSAPIPVGKATIPQRDRNGFVMIKLNPGWTLERRTYQGRTLSHLYFAHQEPVNRLLTKSGENSPGFTRLGSPKPPNRPINSRTTSRPRNRDRILSRGPIQLEVIPYRR